LNLDFHNQLRAAAQVETEMYVLFPVGDELVLGFGNPDNSVDTDKNHRDDNAGLDFDVAIHDSGFWFLISGFWFQRSVTRTRNQKLETVFF
jgi:hypothetical protein